MEGALKSEQRGLTEAAKSLGKVEHSRQREEMLVYVQDPFLLRGPFLGSGFLFSKPESLLRCLSGQIGKIRAFTVGTLQVLSK